MCLRALLIAATSAVKMLAPSWRRNAFSVDHFGMKKAQAVRFGSSWREPSVNTSKLSLGRSSTNFWIFNRAAATHLIWWSPAKLTPCWPTALSRTTSPIMLLFTVHSRLFVLSCRPNSSNSGSWTRSTWPSSPTTLVAFHSAARLLTTSTILFTSTTMAYLLYWIVMHRWFLGPWLSGLTIRGILTKFDKPSADWGSKRQSGVTLDWKLIAKCFATSATTPITCATTPR